MPFGKDGSFHLNSQRAHAHDRMNDGKAAPSARVEKDTKDMKDESSGMESKMTELHDKGDGSFHTKSHDGEEMDHPRIGHALMHIASKHADGKHFHAHHDGMAITAHHHMGEGDGPSEGKEHSDTESAKDHMGMVMDGEEPNTPEGQTEEDNQDTGMSVPSLAGSY